MKIELDKQYETQDGNLEEYLTFHIGDKLAAVPIDILKSKRYDGIKKMFGKSICEELIQWADKNHESFYNSF